MKENSLIDEIISKKNKEEYINQKNMCNEMRTFIFNFLLLLLLLVGFLLFLDRITNTHISILKIYILITFEIAAT